MDWMQGETGNLETVRVLCKSVLPNTERVTMQLHNTAVWTGIAQSV